ncbi:MAG: hypothetical protein ACE5I5_06245 [Candidatus Heimdallarchaeota archaeon]
MSDLKFEKITEYIFAPFNTFIYLDDDEIRLFGTNLIKQNLIKELNRAIIPVKNPNLKIEWCLEESEGVKSAKGVFSPPGKENSFIMARLVDITSQESSFPIKEKILQIFPSNSLKFNNVRFYFTESGVGTCSVLVKLEKSDGLSILQVEEVSEVVNKLYKQYFEDLCFQLTQVFIQSVQNLNIAHHQFEFLPDINEVDKQTYFIPWTHRIYHIHDDSLFNLENPGEPFRFLLTPSRQMDIRDLSIYDNRYIYFGWGHSIIITATQEDGYSQTSKPVYDYVRLVEIAQAKWQFLDVLTDLVTFASTSFNRHYRRMTIEELQKAIHEIRTFENAIDRMLADYRDIKITFDTEKRVLLKELHQLWLTNEVLENLYATLARMKELLDQLYQRQKEKREEALNTIALLFTIIGIVEVFGLAFDIINPTYSLLPIVQFAILAFGTLAMALIITLYLRYAGRG